MSAALIAAMAALGAIGGFLAGLLGFGGGVLMFPLLYYVPPLLGLVRLEAQTVAAVVISQVFFSALVGGVAHLRGGHVQGRLAFVAGAVSARRVLCRRYRLKMDFGAVPAAAIRHCHSLCLAHDVSTGSRA